MINDNIINYILTLNRNKELYNLYDDITKYSDEHYIPAVKFETALFLKWISFLKNPVNILEIGFGSGASSIFMHKGLRQYENFISLERDENRYNRGISILKRHNIDSLQLLKIDAFNYFKSNELKFDLIFLDSVKREYYMYIEPIKGILKKDGILIVDNILFGGKVVENELDDKYADGVKYLKLFNENIKNDTSFETIFLPVGDGLSLSVKN